ncbi:endonuclease/exonuclease/phosphatase family protein, partial [Pseudopedobacter sp.]|uniref:endonuclease/exonuclease/phosphatase family protein n=1 Tax=Pseudopedobacter sp. TaxID=1936787 RepID=UPI00333EE1CF
MKINASILMVLVVLCTIFKASSQHKSLKIVSYNIFDSFRGDSSIKKLFIELAGQEQPDIIALQEVKGYTEQSLNVFAKSLGMQYSALQRERGHSVALISRYPISNVKKVTKNMFHGYIYANILDYHLVVAHLAPFTYMERNMEMDSLIAFLNTLQKEDKVLVMGDLNAMSPADKKSYGTDKIVMMETTEAKNAHIRNLNN